MPDRPNILLITADQLGAGALHCYGGGVPSTPTISAWAARGRRFDRCYATSPVCAPNRATMLTGRSPIAHGVLSNNYGLPGDSPTIAHLLRRAGYRTGLFGKSHQTPMPWAIPVDAGFLGFDEAVLSEDPKWGPWLDWVRGEHPAHWRTALAMCWGASGGGGADAALFAEWRRAHEEILMPLRRASAWAPMYASPLPAEVHDSTFLTDRCLDFMARQQRERRGRPMFCHLSYVDPHDPYDPPEPYASRFAPGDMPRARPATWRHESFAAALESSTHFQGFERIAEDAAVIARLRAYYHGSLAFLDDQFARIDRFLAEHDLWRDTIVVFTSDHGEQLGDHGLITKGIKPYDWGIRCPLVVVGQGVRAGGDDRLSCTLDLVPTMCDWAGIEAADRPPLEGRSAAPAARGEPDPQPWSAVSVAVGAVASVITDDGWRLTRWRGHGGGEMIDLRNDPNEVVNRYRDPGCSAKREDLFERLADVLLLPGRVPQYRSMPRCDGRRHLLGGIGGGQLMPTLADVRIGPSPAFDGGRDNAWRPGWSAAPPGEVT